MKIGVLEIERLDESHLIVLRLAIDLDMGRFSVCGHNDAVVFHPAAGASDKFAEFVTLKSDEVAFPFEEGCSLSLKRDKHGAIDVAMTIGDWKLGPDVRVSANDTVDGEDSTVFLRDLGRLLGLGGR